MLSGAVFASVLVLAPFARSNEPGKDVTLTPSIIPILTTQSCERLALIEYVQEIGGSDRLIIMFV